MKINTTKIYKAFQLMALLVLPFIGDKVYAQTVVKWKSTNGSNTFTGTADLGGTIGTVTATVTISTNRKPAYGQYASAGTDNIGYTGDNTTSMTNPDLSGIKGALGVSDDLTWFYTFKDGLGFPKIVSIKFDKDVVISKLVMTDIDQKLGPKDAWSENFTVSGYLFDSFTSSNFGTDVTLTNAGVKFGDKYTIDNGNPDNGGTMVFKGSNTIATGKSINVTFDGTTAYQTNIGTNVSNEVNPFALFISAPVPMPASVCTAVPAPQFSQSGTATATLNGVSVTRTMSNPKYSPAITSNGTNENHCQASYVAGYGWLYAEGTNAAQTITYTFATPQTSVEVFLLQMGNDEANVTNPMDQADFTVGGSTTGFTLTKVGNYDCQGGVTISNNSVIANYYSNNSTTDAAIKVSSQTPFTTLTITNPRFGFGTGTPTGTNGYGYYVELCPASLQSVCYKPATTTGTTLPTLQGISSLGRAAKNNQDTQNWPLVRTGAWTALEANTKGFVPNRMTTRQRQTAIDLTKPTGSELRGMMIYNTDKKCLEVNTAGSVNGWHCMTVPSCPTVN